MTGHLKSPGRIRGQGFTIVELLIVVVVIAILATIAVVAYNGVANRATLSVLKSDLQTAAKRLGVEHAQDGTYPSPGLPGGINASDGTTFDYFSDGASFCLTATSSTAGVAAHFITESGAVTEGSCPTPPAQTGDALQTVTAENCPSSRTMVVDARDNRTYWIQKMADDKCWMLTNLAYAGGGTNTHSDVKTLTNGTGGSGTFTVASYYVPTSGANVTTSPTAPSTSTSGTGQYGYLYNWCAAMGAQTSTSACANATSPAFNATVSVCPAGWRLPTSGFGGGEFGALNTAINSGSTSSDSGLRTGWLAQYSGLWFSGFSNQGTHGYYWSVLQESATSADNMLIQSSTVTPYSAANKSYGMAVRCITG